MPTMIFSFIPDGTTVKLGHFAFGEDEDAATANLETHAEICPRFGPLFKANRTIQIPVEITELPPSDEEALGQWLDDEFLGSEDDDEEDEEKEDEEDG